MSTQSVVPQHNRRRSERGLTLMEALVAITVFTVVFLVALTLYQAATSSYLRTDSAVIQQQNVRFTMDRMSETLRDAGTGHNMLGSKKLADEQIEGAWESAIFVRGDFDDQRETALENATFPIVTTGNDEIVGYVLRKDGANNQTISVKADLTGTGRDAIYTSDTSIANEETRNIAVAATTLAQQTNPPYQLTKVTFNDAGEPQYEVIADNIKKLSFGYYPATGTTAVNVGNSGADDKRAERAKIRKIQVQLVGMSDRRDMQYKPGYRDFTLDQTILAVNLGVVGAKHNTIPPQALPVPGYITACNGHCRHHLSQWAAADGVSVYRLEITAPDQAGLGAYTNRVDVPNTQYEFTEPDPDIAAGVYREFTFHVAATSGANIGSFTTSVSRSNANDSESKPMPPTNVAGLGAATEYAMQVTWDAVTQNVGPITDTTHCVSAGSIGGGSAPPAPWNQEAIDLTDSKVYRVRYDGSVTGAEATVDVSNQQIGALKNAVSNTAFRDRTAAPCSSYFYRVKACDLCTVTSEYSDAMTTPVAFTVPAGTTPAKPPAAPSVLGTVTSAGTNYVVQLQWSPVTAASDGKPAATAHYKLNRYRSLGSPNSYGSSPEVSYDIYEGTVGPVDTVPTIVGTQAAYYRYTVQGIYDCSPSAPGPESDPYDLACTPPAGNTVAVSLPAANDVFTRPSESTIPLELTVAGTGWTGASVTVSDLFGNVLNQQTSNIPPAGTKYTFTPYLIPDSVPDGVYQVSATANVGSCQALATSTTFTIDTTVCGQRIVNASFPGSGNNRGQSMEFYIENTCPNTVSLTAMKFAFSGVPSSLRLIRLVGGSTYYNNNTGVANGGTMTFASSLDLAAGTQTTPSTSQKLTLSVNSHFTSDGGKDAAFGKFTSILANVITPATTTEELVDGTQIP